MEGIVEKVYDVPSVPPVIAITEVGCLNSSTSLDCKMAIEYTSKRPVLKIFNQNGDTIEEEDTSKKDNSKTYLILRNKKTQKVSIYGTKVTYFKKPDYFKLKTFEQSNLSLTDKEHAFNVVFGTKKISRLSKSKNKEVVVAKETIFNNISSTNSSQNSFSLTSEFLLYLPLGCNRFSNKVELIYPISSLLTESEIDSMTDIAKEVVSMLPVPEDNKDLTKFFISSVNRLAHKTIQNICLLTLADGLIELLKKKCINFNYNRELIVYPSCQLINEKILNNFLDYRITGIDFTSKMKDKALCHIIIIMILVNSNVFELNWLTPYLAPNYQRRLIILMRIVGASAFKEDKTKYTLKIPLVSLPVYNHKNSFAKAHR